jgi:FMN hydrolase / 5-amino-6-(5-phospho-D-ribitylamino)uracil phosphatase
MAWGTLQRVAHLNPLQPNLIRAITLDLDDTLWPVWPVIERAEAALLQWLVTHAPQTAARFDLAGMRVVREQVARDQPTLAHDLSALRREAIERMLVASGEDSALAGPAFEVFFAARQRVELYADALPALQRLSARWPLLGLSNGNADIDRIGLGRWFRGSLGAHEAGVSKPDSRIFHVACERLGCTPGEVLHVGDDLRLDVHGSLGAGLQAAWIRRAGQVTDSEAAPCWQGHDLQALADALGA